MQIWAVGGGKGGTGKSFVTSGLAVCLAERGLNVVLVDADFGGANLHTYLGVMKPEKTLESFRVDKVPLQELVLNTPIPKVGLIAGDVNSTNTTGLTHAQKKKFFRHIRGLQADVVLLDLGAGTRHVTVDTFLLADRMIAVTVPERMAIENLYQFMKNAYFRRLSKLFREAGIREEARELWGNRSRYGIRSVTELTDHLSREFPEFSQLYARDMNSFCIHLVLNKVREYRQTETGIAIRSMANKFLGIPCEFSGHVRYDRDFWNKLVQEPIHLNRVTAARLLVDMCRTANELLDDPRGVYESGGA